MTVAEMVLAVAVVIAATVAAILNSLTPELAGLLGVALGYVTKGAIVSKAVGGILPFSGRVASQGREQPFQGAPKG